jgi:preprotein translocase subunit SecA
MQKLGMEQGEAIEHPWVTKAIENAQRKVEGHNFDIRKQLLDYDDVANDQRQKIYELRDELLSDNDIAETIDALRADVLEELIDQHIPPQSLEEQWDVAGLNKALESEFALHVDVQQWLDDDPQLHEELLRQKLFDAVVADYQAKEEQAGAEVMRQFEKAVMLQVLDSQWKDHLAAMDYLRQGIHLRGYAQKNPKQEYKREAFELFTALLHNINAEVVGILSKVRVRAETDVEAVEQRRRASAPEMQYQHAEASALADGGQAPAGEGEAQEQPFVRDGRKVGRNEPCPCGSGKKYKQCHGRLK